MKICNQVHFQFSQCTLAVFCLGRITLCKPVSYTQPKISIIYLTFTVELTHGLVCYDSIYIVLIFLLLVHKAIKDLDLELKLVDLTRLLLFLIQVCHGDNCQLHIKQFHKVSQTAMKLFIICLASSSIRIIANHEFSIMDE